MAQSKTWNGTSYSIPDASDENWPTLTNFLVALADNAQTINFQKFSVRVATSSPDSVSAATDCVVLYALSVAGAVAVSLPAGVNKQIIILGDRTGDAATNNITITPDGSETINGAATLVLNHNNQVCMLQYSTSGTRWNILYNYIPPGSIVNADIAAAAAIARTKIASGTASHVIINDGSGVLSSEATLAKVRGGAGADMSSVTFPSSGTLATIAGTQVLTNKDIDGATASNSSRITLPGAATATLNALTRKAGTVLYDTTTGEVKFDNGSALAALSTQAEAGAAQSGIVNLSAQTLGAGIKYFKDGIKGPWAATVGDDSNTTLVVTDNRVQIVTPSAARNYTLPTTSVLKGDIWTIVNLAAVTSLSLQIKVKSSDGDQLATVYPQSTVRLLALQDTPTDRTHWIALDRITSSWMAFTPAGAQTTNATYTGYLRRDGQNLEMIVNCAYAGATDAVDQAITLPLSLNVDTTTILGTDVNAICFGEGVFYDSSGGTARYPIKVGYGSATTVRYWAANATSAYASQDTTNPVTPASGDYSRTKIIVPVTVWENNRDS